MADAALPILFADERLVILNKPAGLPVHPGRAGGASVEDWFDALSRRRTGPWLAHRLDTDTAGCLAVALRKAVLLELQALFAAHRVAKTYWAVVVGGPPGVAGRAEQPIGRREDRKGWRMAVDPAGQPAQTDWRCLQEGDGLSWLELRPRTGRTHQIRVHCAALGCPILGDPIYGGGTEVPMHLLARALDLPLAVPAGATAPPPAHMLGALRRLGFTG